MADTLRYTTESRPGRTIPLAQRKAYTRRVDVGAYYTDGCRMAEIVHVYELGAIKLRDSATDDAFVLGIMAFRREWWRAR